MKEIPEPCDKLRITFLFQILCELLMCKQKHPDKSIDITDILKRKTSKIKLAICKYRSANK